MNRLKTPPHSIEAEQSILGGLMLSNASFDDVSLMLGADDFYSADHRLIFQGIANLIAKSRPADFVTLSEYLRDRNELEAAGGISYLGTLVADTPGTANILAYAQIVQERSTLRAIAAFGHSATAIAYEPSGQPTDVILDGIDQRLFDIRQRGARGEGQPIPIPELLGPATRRIEELSKTGGGVSGVATGFRSFDEMTTGLHPGDLVVLAARPGVGKTSLALNMAENVVLVSGHPVLVFNLEMSAEQLTLRVLASVGGIPQHVLRSGRLTDHDWARLADCTGRLQNAQLFIDDTPSLSVMELKSRARRCARKVPLAMIVVDYLQLMQSSRATENRTNEIGEISRGLKILAKELGVPVIALSQLNRSVENRENKTPRLADLRDSGAIEQDADIVMFIHRDTSVMSMDPTTSTTHAELIIAKHRNGDTGKIPLVFDGRYSRFVEDRTSG